MKPASEALAYRVWALCQPRGWGMTLKDCADELGENVNRVRAVAHHKGWLGRFRMTATSDPDTFGPRAMIGLHMPGAVMREAIADLVGHVQRGADE